MLKKIREKFSEEATVDYRYFEAMFFIMLFFSFKITVLCSILLKTR